MHFQITGCSEELQCKTLGEEAMSVHATRGKGQLQGGGSQKVLQCSLLPLEAVLRCRAGQGIVWLCSLSPLEAVVSCHVRCWKEWKCQFPGRMRSQSKSPVSSGNFHEISTYLEWVALHGMWDVDPLGVCPFLSSASPLPITFLPSPSLCSSGSTAN